jgi:Glycosyltransferase like family 2
MNNPTQKQSAPAGESQQPILVPRIQVPRVSVILATDSYETIRRVVEQLRRQTVREQIEIVVIAPSAAAVDAVLAYRQEFAAVQIVESSCTSISALRAQGIRSAASPIVFIGETHSYPHPNMVEALLPVFSKPWAAVTPAICNANPKGALSWAGLLSDYGQWTEGFDAGEIPAAPPHNAAFRRSVLLELGDRLEPALGFSDELPLWMRVHGHRVYFEPAARIDHANVDRLGHWIGARFAAGWVVASERLHLWSWARRLVYVGGSVLIPFVVIWRIIPGVRRSARHQHLPVATLPALMLAAIVKAMGELCGYAGGAVTRVEHRMHEYEMHRLAFLLPGSLQPQTAAQSSATGRIAA